MAKSCRSAFVFWFMAILAFQSACGELLFTNYNDSQPLTIMGTGDSITDDCVNNGAWRQFLQPLLESNGYAFTFVGRQSSVPSGNFTKTLHEGYCGAVIALPGELTYSVHGYPGPDVYLQKTLGDALTNVTPNLILVLIGANDIGRGRDPGVTATNDIPNLLDIIFSNAPNANVILAKITTMQGANNIGGLDYATNDNNVSIYNACLQRVVNQRHAAGQSIFLADMFSVVDYATMFNPDHLHPNLIGLQAMANEWLTRIQSITVGGDTVLSVLVKGGDNWSYSDTGQDLGSNWMLPDFGDSGWSNGPARLGYGDKEAATTIRYGPASTNKYPTTYFRHTFVVPPDITITNLVLRLTQEHGSVVWLNGQELWRTNLPAGPITYTNLALTKPASFDAPYMFNPVNVDPSALVPGTNLIAVELHQLNSSFPAAGFDMELIGTGTKNFLPSLSIDNTGTHLILSWPAYGSDGFGLYSSANLTTPNWTPAGVSAQTNGGQIVVTQALDAGVKFFRLLKP